MASERGPRQPPSQRPPTFVARPGSINRGFESSDPERQREPTGAREPQQSAPKQANAVPPASARRPRRDRGVGTG